MDAYITGPYGVCYALPILKAGFEHLELYVRTHIKVLELSNLSLSTFPSKKTKHSE